MISKLFPPNGVSQRAFAEENQALATVELLIFLLFAETLALRKHYGEKAKYVEPKLYEQTVFLAMRKDDRESKESARKIHASFERLRAKRFAEYSAVLMGNTLPDQLKDMGDLTHLLARNEVAQVAIKNALKMEQLPEFFDVVFASQHFKTVIDDVPKVLEKFELVPSLPK
jgi:hypothetical protein